MHVEVSVDIPAPVEQVWAIVQDPELRPLWDVRVAKYEVHGEPGAGTEVTITLRAGLLRPRARGKFLRWAPPHQSVVQLRPLEMGALVAPGAGSWTFKAIDGGTRYTSRFTLDDKQLSPIMPKRLYALLVKWDTQRSFRRLRALVLKRLADHT